MSERWIGVDVGGTAAKLVCLESDGTVAARATIDSRRRRAAELVGALAAATLPWRENRDAPVTALGVAIPGLVDRAAGRVLPGCNLAYLDDVAIAARLQDALDLPVVLDNDANAAGLAEGRLGAARDCGSAVCLTVGFGIGGAILIDGRLWRGCSGMAGELGRLRLRPDSDRSLEEEAAAAAIVAEYRRRDGEVDDDHDVAAIAARADAGDAAAQRALVTCGERLGVGLAIVVNVLNPERIVIGGGIARSTAWFLEPARRAGRQRARTVAWDRCEVVTAQLGADAGAIGAALLCAEGGAG